MKIGVGLPIREPHIDGSFLTEWARRADRAGFSSLAVTDRVVFYAKEPLIALEREFAGHFVRIHRNCLVARHAIRGFERGAEGDDDPHWLVVLDGVAERLPVSRRQWPVLRELVAERP